MLGLRNSLRVGLVLAAIAGRPGSLHGQAEPPQVVQLTTGDGVQLGITYYPAAIRPGMPGAKQVTPVVILHDHKGARAPFGPLATLLQTPPENDPKRTSFAVVLVDLRGHGDSTKQAFPNGSQVNLDAGRIDKADVYSMAALDMEAVRRFLRDKNDEGALNLNKLCLVGSGMGANVAANWAVEDWRVPPLAVVKQGQDVKAMVMISPRWTFQGLSLQGPMRLRPLKQQVAWMLIYGSEDPEITADAHRIERQLKPFHPETDGSGAARASDFVVMAVPTKLQGDNLVTKLGGNLNDQILGFLIDNVAAKELPWTARRVR